MNSRFEKMAVVTVLLLINAVNFFDRQILGAVAEMVRKEWSLSDSQLGLLSTAFTLLYAVIGLPLGRLADVFRRTRLLAVGVFAWSALTALSGYASSFRQLFLVRLGVGAGEATCAPAATSLLGDVFDSRSRSRALSLFMLGLPLGLGLSYWVSSAIAHEKGWRAAFKIAGIPGVILALLVLFIREPKRGAADPHLVSEGKVSPWELLRRPTLLWLIVSGALHNFNMYAIGGFLTAYLLRFHHVDQLQAGKLSMVINGFSGVPGLLLGGILADRFSKSRAEGRLWTGTVAMFLATPLLFFGIASPAGSVVQFATLMTIGCGLMFIYYSAVYPTIHDVVEPELRGTGMALYFMAMYLFGASFGPYLTGLASDYFTHQAALGAGVTSLAKEALEPFRAPGLRKAMIIIPILSFFLTIVLFLASRTLHRDLRKRKTDGTCKEPAQQAAVEGG